MKVLKWILIVLIVLAVAAYGGFQYMKSETKKHSPQDTAIYEADQFKIKVEYSRPYKKGREIFGGLVPYEEVWRTGANEPTTLTVNQDIQFGDEELKAGTYTLWTIPYTSQWTIIVNSKMYGWGVGWDSKPSRDPKYDVLKINVPVQELNDVVEQFTIDFEYHVNLSMAWDKSKVMVPIMY